MNPFTHCPTASPDEKFFLQPVTGNQQPVTIFAALLILLTIQHDNLENGTPSDPNVRVFGRHIRNIGFLLETRLAIVDLYVPSIVCYVLCGSNKFVVATSGWSA